MTEQDVFCFSQITDSIHIQIARPANGDYSVPLDAFLSAKISDLAVNAPLFWESFAGQRLIPPEARVSKTADHPDEAVAKAEGSDVKPRIISPFSLVVNSYAKQYVIGRGASFLSFVVDTSGQATQIRIVRPFGLGFDEDGIAAVQRLKFAPATREGKPIAVESEIEVDFETYHSSVSVSSVR